MLVIVEPSQRSVETAYKIKKLAADLGVKKISAIANKVRNIQEEKFLKDYMPDFNILGFLPYDDGIIESDRSGRAIYNNNRVVEGIKDIRDKITKM
jgi:CO dehydrogenase maturation factor